MEHLNIVVICLDTFRADLVGPGYRLSRVATPALDQLAAGSVRFNQCFGETLATLQVRNTNFTGMRMFPFKHGYYGWHEIPREYPALAEHLVEAGYATGLIGDTPHMFKPNMNYSRGFLTFEHIRGQTSDSWKTGPWDLVADLFRDYFGDYVPRAPKDPNAALYQEGQVLQYLHNVRDRRSEEDWFAPRVFESGCRWIEENATNGPFFLWLDCFETHELYDPPLEYIKQYNDTWAGPKYQQPQHILSSRLHSDVAGDSVEVQGLSDEFIEYYRACYFGEVTLTDKHVGMFLERLDRLGLSDSTVVIFTSDHGTELADLTGIGKREAHLHPFTTQLNLTIRHPDESLRDRDVDALVQNQHLAPTILDLAGISEAAEGMDGQSLMGMLSGDEIELHDFVITGWNDYASVRDNNWNYVINYMAEIPQPELYDLRSDPEEARNVHDDHPEVSASMKRRLEEHLGGELPRPQDQLHTDGALGRSYKPLYSTSYAPLFYRARMRWDVPRALPR